MARLPGVDEAFAVVRGAATAAVDAAAAVVATARAAGEVVEQARETVQAVQRLALRADGIVAELEEPLRALAPGLARLAEVLDDPVVDELPATLRQVQTDVLPVLRTLAETHERVAALTALPAFAAGLPGAAFLGRRRPAVDPTA